MRPDAVDDEFVDRLGDTNSLELAKAAAKDHNIVGHYRSRRMMRVGVIRQKTPKNIARVRRNGCQAGMGEKNDLPHAGDGGGNGRSKVIRGRDVEAGRATIIHRPDVRSIGFLKRQEPVLALGGSVHYDQVTLDCG